MVEAVFGGDEAVVQGLFDGAFFGGFQTRARVADFVADAALVLLRSLFHFLLGAIEADVELAAEQFVGGGGGKAKRAAAKLQPPPGGRCGRERVSRTIPELPG
jgi:hypothetical protein